MQYLILAVLCSVSVSILFKFTKKYQIVTAQMIAFGYVVALSLSYFLLSPNFEGLTFTEFFAQSEAKPIFISLGILLPVGFLVMSKAVEYGGIIRTDAAQRLALFLQIIAAVVIFGETLSDMRIVGIIVAFFALFFLLSKPAGGIKSAVKAAFALAGVWLIWGATGILFKKIALMGGAFPTTLFITFVLAAVIMFIYLLIKRTNWTVSSLIGGIILGCLNFGNILFYIYAHQHFKENPTIVFATMDLGVICLGTLVGATIFKEKISKFNGIGILLGLVAILLLRV
ncbi:EamA family transporter [Histophilus somni]|uniref:EamA family transporter n=1 Tax=Histophilus somni TaxID=731 RepID=UPI00109C602D|nr:DMT family transporter [Histophilus somni]QEH23312.1 DMT family transporter [Histophilus somni]THA52200.1 DMT family transporter [Histophilus somni]